MYAHGLGVRRLASGVACLTLSISCIHSFAADRIYLRDGRIMEGRVLGENQGLYTFQKTDPGAPLERVSKHAVRFVHYADPKQAEQMLGIAAARRHTVGDLTAVGILPTASFASAISDAVERAGASVWISAYYISGSRSASVARFYGKIRELARRGVDVVVVSEYGAGTSAFIRQAAMEYALELSQDGVRVLFIQERKVMHKKMIIVDGREVILGSSNLTAAGTHGSNEMNVHITEPGFVEAAVRDYERVRVRAKPAGDMKY